MGAPAPDETRDPSEREHALFDRLPDFLLRAVAGAPGLALHLAGHDPEAVTDRAALAKLPVLRKAALMEAQAAQPPFGGFAVADRLKGTRYFISPGPIAEPQPPGLDPWRAAAALRAAGIGPDDTILNCFSYHLTPGAWILDEGARSLGSNVIPGGIGNTEAQVDAAAMLRATAYVGTPDFLKALLDNAEARGKDLSRITRALVSGGALFPSLRESYSARGVTVLQCYATADLGVVAFETAGADGAAHPGLVVGEDIIVEIVRPGTGDPVPDGEVGEIVVTVFNPSYPLVRFATGDLSKVVTGPSPCGRTNMRLAGWMGRADQRTKVKGMFVDPRQVADIGRRHPELGRLRLVVARDGDSDIMTLKAEATDADAGSITQTLAAVTKLKGKVELVAPGSLPNDGKVIDDTRDYSA